MLFVSMSLESLSERQWYFRIRLICLNVRSLLTAAIYKKQLRLSNAAKLIHSGGEIMNYVTVDAYRIGEFPFWFHQTWTTSLHLCIVLEPIRSIPDIIGVVIQAKVAFARAVKFLEAPELQSANMGEIVCAAPYHRLLASSKEFQDLVNAHKKTAGSERLAEIASPKRHATPSKELEASKGDQLIKQEEREVSSDLIIVDLDVPFSLIFAVVVTINAFASFGVLAVVTWQVLFVFTTVIYMAIHLQSYYFSTAKELMRINGTTKSLVTNHLAESIAGALTIRAFKEEERFHAKNDSNRLLIYEIS
ncbi:hypothetical protein QYF36_022489 [Acer negundo]|nr:hypothetical protein QYF36_022489 [Acer negundo]